jgi:hypothetical protein
MLPPRDEVESLAQRITGQSGHPTYQFNLGCLLAFAHEMHARGRDSVRFEQLDRTTGDPVNSTENAPAVSRDTTIMQSAVNWSRTMLAVSISRRIRELETEIVERDLNTWDRGPRDGGIAELNRVLAQLQAPIAAPPEPVTAPATEQGAQP